VLDWITTHKPPATYVCVAPAHTLNFAQHTIIRFVCLLLVVVVIIIIIIVIIADACKLKLIKMLTH